MVDGLKVALDQVVQLGALSGRFRPVLLELEEQLCQKHGVLHLTLFELLRQSLVLVNLAIEHHGDFVEL